MTNVIVVSFYSFMFNGKIQYEKKSEIMILEIVVSINYKISLFILNGYPDERKIKPILVVFLHCRYIKTCTISIYFLKTASEPLEYL